MDTFAVRLEMAIESWRNNRRAMEEFCLALQRNTPDFIEMNRNLMRAGKIDVDDYEEIESCKQE